jgi:mannose-1-phosphate guanylyltransferase
MAERIVSFVMSGGVGSRLWPLSREDNPKQFHDLSGDGSMLVKTLRRLKARRKAIRCRVDYALNQGPITRPTDRMHGIVEPGAKSRGQMPASRPHRCTTDRE